MATNYCELSPQQRGIIIVNAQINQLPDGSREQKELLKMRNEAIKAWNNISEDSNNGGRCNYQVAGMVNSRRKRKMPPEKYAEIIAQQMLKGKKSPQEIGAVVAGILGFRG